MNAGPAVVVGKFGYTWVRMGKRGWIRMGQTDRGNGGLGVEVCRQVWPYIAKGGKVEWVLIGQTDWEGMGDISNGWVCVGIHI